MWMIFDLQNMMQLPHYILASDKDPATYPSAWQLSNQVSNIVLLQQYTSYKRSIKVIDQQGNNQVK